MYILRRSEIDPELMEIWHAGQCVQEISVPFVIRKIPKLFESIEKIKQWIQEKEWKSALFTAYRCLSRKNYPSLLLRNKLQQKRYSAAVCDKVIEELKKNGYLQDEEFVQTEILREFKRGYGPRYIEMKLRMKGLPGEKVRLLISDSMQRERIRQWMPKLSVRPDRLSKQKAIRALQRRGFDLDLILENFN